MPVPWVIKSSRDHRRRLGLYEAAAAAAGAWWDPNSEGLSVWAAYAPKGAADLTASYADVSGEGHDAGVGVAPTWDAVNGWIFNGAYLTTTFVPQNDQTQTALVQFTNLIGTNDALFGADNGANRRFRLRSAAGTAVQYENGAPRYQTPVLTAGNLAIAGNQGYRNGIADGAPFGAWGGASALALYIGASNNGAPAQLANVYIQAFTLYDAILTAGQVSAIATAMAAL